jgi:hypothetical protein
VSLILDALKKVELEKDAREPNVLVVGSVPWGARARSRRPLVVALAGTVLVAVVALVVFALWPRGRAARPVAAPPPSVSSPAPAPTPGASSGPSPTAPAPAASIAPPEPPRLSVPRSERVAAEAPPTPAPAADELRLNAISQRDGRPVALINDRLVFEGDGFDGVKVLRIGEAEVEVEVRGQRRVLRF